MPEFRERPASPEPSSPVAPEARPHRSALLDEHARDMAESLVVQATNARKDQGITQAYVAGAMGTSQRTVSQLENMHHVPVLDTFVAYVAALGGEVVVKFPEAETSRPISGG